MTIDQTVLEKLRHLPPDRQQEVLDFVESLEQKTVRKPIRKRLKGLCADLGVTLTEEDVAQARREVWGSFPREEL